MQWCDFGVSNFGDVLFGLELPFDGKKPGTVKYLLSKGYGRSGMSCGVEVGIRYEPEDHDARRF